MHLKRIQQMDQTFTFEACGMMKVDNTMLNDVSVRLDFRLFVYCRTNSIVEHFWSLLLLGIEVDDYLIYITL